MNPQEWVSALTWRDALDFGLLYALVYASLKVARGTRAIPVLMAFAAFGLLAWAANQIDLIASASVLRVFFESIIVLLIIIFQHELRRFFLDFGQRLLPRNRRESAQTAVEELVSGIERLQRARVGLLLVLEGDLSILDRATGRGAEIDAPLRSGILVALAIPHAANTVHDGAILVENFRIMRAGVICPLSDQTLDPRFGTRHRGALGCTEESDALALILSEERGELRIAYRGAISDSIRTSELEAHINHWLSRPREGIRPRRRGESRAEVAAERSSVGLPMPPSDSKEIQR